MFAFGDVSSRHNLELLHKMRLEISLNVQLFKENVYDTHTKRIVEKFVFKLNGKEISKTYNENTYTYGGFHKLTADQVRRIHAIVTE